MIRALANLIFSFFLNVFKRIDCDYNVSMSPRVFAYLVRSKIKKLKLRNAIIGSGVTFSDGVAFYNKPELFGKVSVGRYTSINGPSTRICAEVNSISIGAFCSIASNVIIQEFYHNYNRTSTYFVQSNVFGQPGLPDETISKGPIVIEDDVWIGSNAVILSNVTIGRGAIIGAGSVVTKNVERYAIVAGNPARKLRTRFSDETIHTLEQSEWWLWSEHKMFENQEFFMVNRS